MRILLLIILPFLISYLTSACTQNAVEVVLYPSEVNDDEKILLLYEAESKKFQESQQNLLKKSDLAQTAYYKPEVDIEIIEEDITIANNATTNATVTEETTEKDTQIIADNTAENAKITSNSPTTELTSTKDTILATTQQTYVVQAKDTMYSISQKHGLTVEELSTANNIAPPYSLAIGQELLISNNTTTLPNNKAENLIQAASNNTQDASPTENNNTITTAQKKTPTGLAIDVAPHFKPRTYSNQEEKIASNRVKVGSSKKQGFKKPINSNIIHNYGKQADGSYNDGIYYKAKTGQDVLASSSGTVVYTGNNLKTYGNLIILKHDNGLLSAYGHLQNILVEKGQLVEQGDKIGTAGNSGKVSQPSLYFAIRQGKEVKNPNNYLK